MADNVKLVHDGTIGFFWPGASRARSLRRAPERGYVRRGDDGMLHLAVLDESNLWHTEVDPHLPSLITGMTEAGGIVLLDIAGAGRTTRFGGSAASAKRYRARTLVAGVDVDRIRSGRVGSMSAHFFGISSWFGLTTVEEGQEFHPESNLLKSYTITVDSSPEESIKISGGRELAISVHWGVEGDLDKRNVLAPVSITCRSVRPQPLNNIRYPLLRIQDLISLAYEGFVSAGAGQVRPDASEESRSTPQLWDTFLMASAPGIPTLRTRELPYFDCADIGGIGGLRRWVGLCYRHLRAVRPIVERYRQGRVSPPVRLMEVAAGIEYWVAAHRRSAGWASRKCPNRSHDCGHAWTLASHVGVHFAGWVGDLDRWAERFWSSYNKLKHEPGYSPDEYELHLLAESGHLLLAAALLNRVARNKKPTASILGRSSHRNWQLKAELQRVLT